MIQILAVLGVIGGILCATADCLFDLKGADNIKQGVHKQIDSKWDTMSPKRFLYSTILVMFAVPMYSCGVIALMMKLHTTHQALALIIGGIFLFGAMGGIMIHTVLCLSPTIYKTIMKKSDFDLAEDVLMVIFKQISVPFFTQYAALVIVPAIAIMVLIIMGILPLPLWCVLLNPVVFQIVGLLLRATKCKIFIDAPSIFAASLGLGMYGVLALMLV